jgi:hypothetical protein
LPKSRRSSLHRRRLKFVAFIYVVDPAENTISEGGVPASDLLAMAQEEGKRFLAGFRERSALQPPTLEFLEVGNPVLRS